MCFRLHSRKKHRDGGGNVFVFILNMFYCVSCSLCLYYHMILSYRERERRGRGGGGGASFLSAEKDGADIILLSWT